MKYFIILMICLVSQSPCMGDEFRGIWAWSTFETGASASHHENLFDDLGNYHFNNVMYYTVNIGMANYPSALVPWNESLTGEIGKDPGWNPLATAIEMAHSRGILVHAKLNIYLAWLVNKPLPTSPLHPVNAHPEWILVGRDGKMMSNDGEHLFFNPCHPEVQNLVYDYCLEIANNYNVDGLHFDYIRFPNTGYSWDPVTLNRFWARYGKSPDSLPNEWAQWRRDQITNLLIRIKTAIRRHHWNIVLGADVWADRTSGVNGALQDMELWRERKILDFDVPMLYTTDIGSFDSWLSDHQNHTHGRFVFPGIAAHQMGGNTSFLDEQITLSRDHHTSGVVIYKDSALFPNNVPNAMAEYLKTNLFIFPTDSPIFPWKTKTEFDPPDFLGLESAEPRNKGAVLRWQPGSDSTLPITYTIYQNEISGLDDFTTPTYAAQDTQFFVEGLENGKTYYFIVRAEDEFANEDHNTKEISVTPSETSTFPLENFEAGTDNYWNGNHENGIIFQAPDHSPYTSGIDDSTSLVLQNENVHSGSYAGSISIKWTDPVNGQCFLETDPLSPLCPDFTGWFSLWIYGENDGTRFAPVFRDDAMERTPFVTIDWTGWKMLEWFLPQTPLTGLYGGDGKLAGGIFGGEFAGILILPGASSDSSLLIDDIENQIRQDVFPPLFSGLETVSSLTGSAKLSWSMAMDASNPITYNIYMSSSPAGFNFSVPTTTTKELEFTFKFLPSTETRYFIVRAEDACGNEETNELVKSLGPFAEEKLEDFESGSASYWNGNHSQGIIFEDPNYSGTTSGLDDSSKWEIVTTPTIAGNYAGKLYLKWTDMQNGFSRATTHPQRPVLSDLRVIISAWIYGAGDDTQIALNLLDDLHEGAYEKEYEQTLYITIDWIGWRKLEWDLMKVKWISWLSYGTGTLEDPSAGAHFDGLFFLPGKNLETSLFLDEFVIHAPPLFPQIWMIY